jgi:hypothetical protein
MMILRTIRQAIWVLGLLLGATLPASAQIVYFNTINGAIYSLNIATCQSTFIVNGNAANDMAVGPNTNTMYGLFGQTLFQTNVSTGVSTSVLTVPPVISPSLEYGPNGLLYLTGQFVWAVNPVTGTFTNNGALPAGWFSLGDLVYFQGQYYETVGTPSGDYLAIINVNNPGASTLVAPAPPNTFLVAGAGVEHPTCPKMYWFSYVSPNTPSTVYEYDVNTQTWTVICPSFSFAAAGGDTPNGYTFPLTCNNCTTNAGIISTGPVINGCLGTTVTIAAATQTTLDANDLLQYILYSNINNPAGSIIATNNTPSFVFNAATMQTNTNYYITSIAGNNQNGNVNLADPCFDIGTGSRTVIWRPNPNISFSANADLCAGNCTPVNVNLIGSPPFTFTYSINNGAPLSASSNSANSSVNICIPTNTPPGPVLLQALTITDAFCTCTN